jgi:hypothetical protein
MLQLCPKSILALSHMFVKDDLRSWPSLCRTLVASSFTELDCFLMPVNCLQKKSGVLLCSDGLFSETCEFFVEQI